MRITIVHYHLRVGGVTRVIELTREALERRGHEVLVVAGEPAPGATLVPGLAYGAGAREAEALIEGVERAELRRWGAGSDVLHVHNHALGKNLSLPVAAIRWARSGRPMLLHLHDFAENGRPANYRYLRDGLGDLAELYPVGGRVGLAVLTSAAARRIRAAGGEAIVLPNPVEAPRAARPLAARDLGAERMVVYPARAIRRKNIGEFLLHAALAEPGGLFALTSPPPGGFDWQSVAARVGLPVLFDACRKASCGVGDLLCAADYVLTTSVEEGFGLAFVEPLAAGRPVWGRDLPDVTSDFRELGLPLDGLYPRWDVPLRRLDAKAIRAAIAGRTRQMLRDYGLPVCEERIRRAVRAVVGGESVDFAQLEEDLQVGIVARPRDYDLHLPGLRLPTPDELARAGAILARHYSPAAAAQRLESTYQTLCANPPSAPAFLDPRRLLDAFQRA